MAFADSADLLARCKLLSGVPAPTEFPADADWYSFLTMAHAYWLNEITTHAPWANMGAPTLLTSSDSGETYPFASSISPLAVEVYDTKNGRLLAPAGYMNTGGDYVWEGDKLRFPGGVTKTFADGPYARYVTPGTTVSAAAEPTLKPVVARVLLVVPRAVVMWAERGGMRDPAPFYRMEQRAWLGNPAQGELGILGQLVNQNIWHGLTAHPPRNLQWYEVITTGAGYSPYP